MRMIVPMDDLDAARWINLTGASGHAFDSHYADQADLWAKGQTLPWAFSSKAVHSSAAAHAGATAGPLTSTGCGLA